MEGHSEIAQVRQENRLREETAKRGLNAYAIVSPHDTITARMDNGALLLLELTEQGRHEEAAKIMDTGNWC
jgi:hypothetical protein